MELLSPAGSMEQALAAIEAGCHALYGGLKQWSARNRASNFTINEYKALITICHQKNIKFYLTINTLLKNSEIEEIEQLFYSQDFILPDAVLVADIGLINMLRCKFSSLELHASTQFGATTLHDVLYLEQLGIKRVVLAREVTLNEIKYIKENSNIDIEIFVYGSQCIAYSGQCLWGGMINGCSGNRGRCIGMCRDIYESNNKIGQFMYPQDINAISMIDILKEIGINSIKIEGRMRTVKEISEIVSLYRKAIDSESPKELNYVGYLNNIVPVKNILNAVNPRLKTTNEDNFDFGPNDLLLNTDINGNDELYWGIDFETGMKHVKTVFSNALLNGEVNISLKPIFTNDVLHKIDFINNYGERKVFDLYSEPDSEFRIIDLYNHCSNFLNFNIYEFISMLSEKHVIKFNLGSLNLALTEINTLCMSEVSIVASGLIEAFRKTTNVVIETNSTKDLIKIYNKGYKSFIYDIVSIEELNKILNNAPNDTQITYRLPILDFQNKTRDIVKLLSGKDIMISKLSHISYLNDILFNSVKADYTLNIWNDYAVSYLKNQKIICATFHPELSFESNTKLFESNDMKASIIAYGKIPLGYTRACFKELDLCSGNCLENSIEMANISKGYSIQIYCNNEFGFRTIVSQNPSIALKTNEKLIVRAMFSDIGEEEYSEFLDRKIFKNHAVLYREDVQ